MNVPARRANGQLIGGQGSLNPSGRPRNAIEELRAKYMHRLPEMFDGLFQLTNSEIETIRLQAIREIRHVSLTAGVRAGLAECAR